MEKKWEYDNFSTKVLRRFWVTINPSLRVRLTFFDAIIRQVKGDAGSFLDAGCSVGDMLDRAKIIFPATVKLVGVDVDPANVLKASDRFKSDRTVKIFCCGLETLSFKGDFNLIWCSQVLEHIDDWALALTRLVEALTADGTLVINVPYDAFRKREDPSEDLHDHYWSGFAETDFAPHLEALSCSWTALPRAEMPLLSLGDTLFHKAKRNRALLLLVSPITAFIGFWYHAKAKSGRTPWLTIVVKKRV